MRRVGKRDNVWCQEYRERMGNNVRFQQRYTEKETAETYLCDEVLKGNKTDTLILNDKTKRKEGEANTYRQWGHQGMLLQRRNSRPTAELN